jgi:hypothetical protein
MFMFEAIPWYSWLAWAAILAGLILLNEVTRHDKYTGLAFFVVLPLVLNIFVWPRTSGASSGAQTANWFAWTKVWSALIGCYIGLSLRFTKLKEHRWALALAPAILAINIMEAVVREFEVTGMHGIVEGMFYMGGPWNIMNGVAGLLNMLTICGWFGIVFSKGKSHDLVWPDMTWFWIIAYDLWNFAYTYNCLTDRSFYSAALLISCTIPAFTIKKGAWAQHRVQTLALYMMAMMTVPNFFVQGKYAVASTHNPAAYYAISSLALAANVAVAAYQVYVIVKKRKNPFKDELYSDSKSSRALKAANS